LRTTKLYDGTTDEISLDEVERIKYAEIVIGSMSSSPRWCSSHQSKKRFTARVGHPGIAVADGRGKEFDEAEAGAFAPGLRSPPAARRVLRAPARAAV
jgi:hypothetical protein